MKISNFVVFNTTRQHGQMNSGAAFYPNDLGADARMKLMRENKMKIAEEVRFDINKIFMALQANKNHSYEPGTSYTLTKDDVSNYTDLYDYDVWADTVKLTPETPNCVIGFNVSDAPNVIAMNVETGEATSTFCSGIHINNEVPAMIKETLGGQAKDIMVSVSPFAHILPWMGQTYDDEPVWTHNKNAWKDCIERHGSMLLINQKEALLKQLLASGILLENIMMGEDSLYNANDYYSSQRARLMNDKSPDGRFMHGVMLQEFDSLFDILETRLSFYGLDNGSVTPVYRKPYIRVISREKS